MVTYDHITLNNQARNMAFVDWSSQFREHHRVKRLQQKSVAIQVKTLLCMILRAKLGLILIEFSRLLKEKRLMKLPGNYKNNEHPIKLQITLQL